MLSRVPADLQTGHLPNKSLNYYRYTNLPGQQVGL